MIEYSREKEDILDETIEEDKEIFKKLNIYLEIFNNKVNQSEIMQDILASRGANVKQHIY